MYRCTICAVNLGKNPRWSVESLHRTHSIISKLIILNVRGAPYVS